MGKDTKRGFGPKADTPLVRGTAIPESAGVRRATDVVDDEVAFPGSTCIR
jgi:hypothetical protein